MYEEKRIYDTGSINNLTASAEAKQPQVHEAIHYLESMVEQNLKMAAEIEQRLSPVLRNEPQAAGNDPKDAKSQVPIAGRITESAIQLNKILETYRSMLRRLEV